MLEDVCRGNVRDCSKSIRPKYCRENGRLHTEVVKRKWSGQTAPGSLILAMLVNLKSRIQILMFAKMS